MVAGSSLVARRICALGPVVLLADSTVGLGWLAVIAAPSRTRPTQRASGSIANIP